MNLNQTIKNNDTIIVHGQIGQGKEYLLSKLATASRWKGRTHHPFSELTIEELTKEPILYFVGDYENFDKFDLMFFLRNSRENKKLFLDGLLQKRISTELNQWESFNYLHIIAKGMKQEWDWIKWERKYYLRLDYVELSTPLFLHRHKQFKTVRIAFTQADLEELTKEKEIIKETAFEKDKKEVIEQ